MVTLIANLLSVIESFWKSILRSYNLTHKHDTTKFSNMVWISEAHRLNCQMIISWKKVSQLTRSYWLSYIVNNVVLCCCFLHCRSYFYQLYMLAHDLWDEKYETYGQFVGFKDLLNKAFCMQSHPKMWIILRITACRQHFSHKLTHSCTHLLILTVFEGYSVYSERKLFPFDFKCSAILRLQIFSTVWCKLQVLANLVYCTGYYM